MFVVTAAYAGYNVGKNGRMQEEKERKEPDI